jgi:hypothetical protein
MSSELGAAQGYIFLLTLFCIHKYLRYGTHMLISFDCLLLNQMIYLFISSHG